MKPVTNKVKISISLLLLVLALIPFSNTNLAMEYDQTINVTNSYSLYTESSDEANHNVYLYMDLDENIVEATLFYYNLSYIPKEYEINKKVSNGSISFLIPENHTGMPGIEYYFMLLTRDGHQVKTSTYSEVFDISPYFDDYEDISIRSTGSAQMWWDIEFRGGVTPCGKNISNRRQTAKLPFRNLTPAVTSKSMEIRNISGSNFHRGIDFGAPKGTPVYHIFDSSVVRRIQDDGSSGYGKYVMVEFERGTTVYYVLYAHLDRFHPDLRVGQSIGSNTIIGYVGNTGNSTGDHLHMEFYYWDTSRKNLYPARYFFVPTTLYNSLRDFDVIQTPYRAYVDYITRVRVYASSVQTPSADVLGIAYRKQGTSTWTTASFTKINTTTHLWEYKFPSSLNGSTVEYYISFRKTFGGVNRWVFRPAYWAYTDYYAHPNPYGDKYYTVYVGHTGPLGSDNEYGSENNLTIH